MTDRTHVQVIRGKPNLPFSSGSKGIRCAPNRSSTEVPQVVRLSRHQPFKNQNTNPSKRNQIVSRKFTSLSDSIHCIGQKSIDANDRMQSISVIILDSNKTNKFKQASKTITIPSVNIKRNVSDLPSLLQARPSKCDDYNNHSKKNSQLAKQQSDQNEWIGTSHQRYQIKKRGFLKQYCGCLSVCTFLSLIGLIFLGAILAVITTAVLASKKTTVTTTVAITATSQLTTTTATTTTTVTTTYTTTTTTTAIPCIPVCSLEQTCTEGICTNVGYLACTVTWSRPGDGDIVVTTPNNRTIYYKNRGPSATTDGGQLDRDDQVGTGPENVYWSQNGTVPPTGTYYVCFEPYSINPTISISNPLTAVYHIVRPWNNILTIIRTFTSVLKNSYNCDTTSATLMGSFTYP